MLPAAVGVKWDQGLLAWGDRDRRWGYRARTCRFLQVRTARPSGQGGLGGVEPREGLCWYYMEDARSSCGGGETGYQLKLDSKGSRIDGVVWQIEEQWRLRTP